MVARVRRCRRIFRNIEPNGCHRGGGGLPLATTTRHPRHNLVIPAKAGISLPFPLPPRLGALPLRPRSRAILSPERAKDPDLFLTNLSLDVNISRSQGLTSFDCSLEKLTSRSKNTRTDLVHKCFAVKTFWGQKPFLQEETLVTVSPCEFPPRVLVTCVLSAISRNCNSFFFCPGFIPAHKEPL